MDTLYFFASDEDMHTIFDVIETEFDIKYCILRTENDLDYKPVLEFKSIRELELRNARYLIADKHKIMNTLYYEKYSYYENSYMDNQDSVVFIGRKTYGNDALGDYQLHIHLGFESEYAKVLFKKIVREVKRNCIKVKNPSPLYIGKELFENRKDYIFFGQRAMFPIVITDTGETKRWWYDEHVRTFIDKPIDEQLNFLSKVFSNSVIDDYVEESNNRTVNWQIYEGVMSKLYSLKELDDIKLILPLFNDSSMSISPYAMAKSAMDELLKLVIDLAFSYKAEGITYLVKNLCLIPERGYNSGSKAIVQILLKKKYVEIFTKSLSDITREERDRVKLILNDISEKRLVNTRDMILGRWL